MIFYLFLQFCVILLCCFQLKERAAYTTKYSLRKIDSKILLIFKLNIKLNIILNIKLHWLLEIFVTDRNKTLLGDFLRFKIFLSIDLNSDYQQLTATFRHRIDIFSMHRVRRNIASIREFHRADRQFERKADRYNVPARRLVPIVEWNLIRSRMNEIVLARFVSLSRACYTLARSRVGDRTWFKVIAADQL